MNDKEYEGRRKQILKYICLLKSRYIEEVYKEFIDILKREMKRSQWG